VARAACRCLAWDGKNPQQRRRWDRLYNPPVIYRRCQKLFLGFLLVLPRGALADAAPRYTAQLRAECDQLISCAIRRPYGWAWDLEAKSELAAHPSPRPVTMQLLGTPSAGLALLFAGKLLTEPRYTEAAEEAARGVAAAQMPIGRVRANPIFGPIAGGREETAVIADRSATRCGLGLLLAFADQAQSDAAASGSHAEAIHRAAARAARWLAKQQAPNGLWPSAFPPDAKPRDAIRLVRLDDNDYRDATFALLLSFDLLHDATLGHFADQPLSALLKLRLVSDVHGPGLWSTACTVNGTDIPPGFPDGPDLLASRYAIQTLLGGFLFTQDTTLIPALDQAATTLDQVKHADGTFDRFLDPSAAAEITRSVGDPTFFTPRPTTYPATAPSTHSVLASTVTSGTFDIPQVLDESAHLKSLGRDRYVASLAATSSLHDQTEASLCGLTDDPFALDFPQKLAEIPAYLTAHADLWKVTDGPVPDDLAGRVRRIWVLLLEAKLERLTQARSQ
jgi:hypothetical protein